MLENISFPYTYYDINLLSLKELTMTAALTDFTRSITKTYLASWATDEADEVFANDPSEVVVPQPEVSIESLIEWNDKIHISFQMDKCFN